VQVEKRAESRLPEGEAVPAWQVVLGLGSNLGDREGTLGAAVTSLGKLPGVVVLGRSGWMETPPWGLADQPAFLNGAVLIATTLSPFALLAATRAIEAAAGRTRVIRWGPRTLDIDLLWTHGSVVDHPDLQLPHPRLTERVFALGPLLELVPDAADPRTGTPYLASLDSLRKG
jgi:2-amino-4-hydroxy-6-hydroxymethyldihydropteridine diphosphokinase